MKMIKRILLSGLVAVLLASVAFAADLECIPANGATLTVKDGTYTAALNGATGGANGYALLVVSVDESLGETIKQDIKAGTLKTGYGWSISDSNVLYIAQNAAASFTFKPLANKTSVILLCGADNSPIILGLLKSKDKPGDVNGDSNINALDRTLLTHFTNDWPNAQDSRLVTMADTIQQNGDLTGDGSIDAQDRTLLAHYTNKWPNAQDSRLAAYKALIGEN